MPALVVDVRPEDEPLVVVVMLPELIGRDVGPVNVPLDTPVIVAVW